jgi:hypothetical protein
MDIIEVKSENKYKEINSFKELEVFGIKVGKSYLTFNYGIDKIKIYYKNKSLVDICNKLNYEYGFGILCKGVNLYFDCEEFGEETFLTPKVSKNKLIQLIGVYSGNDSVKINV